MITLEIEMKTQHAQQVTVTDDFLEVDLVDGRSITAPLAWYPRLLHATAKERNNWRFIGDGVGIHWSELDEDLSVEGLLLGRPSAESQRSLQRWLESARAHFITNDRTYQVSPETGLDAIRQMLGQWRGRRVALVLPEGWLELDNVARMRLLQRQAIFQQVEVGPGDPRCGHPRRCQCGGRARLCASRSGGQ